MKRLLFTISVWILLSFLNNTHGQTSVWQDNISLGLNSGISSFYGDLSVYDRQPIKKISNESDLAFGVTLGHELSSNLSLYLCYINGKLRGQNDEFKYYFNSDLNEFSIASHISISNLIFPYRTGRAEVFTTTGIGLLNFHSVERTIIENGKDWELDNNIVYAVKSNTPIIKLGMGCNYEVNSHLNLSTEIAFRVTGNDMIDAHEGSTGINDYYSIFSIGFTYVFSNSRSFSNYSFPCGANSKSYKAQNSRIHHACTPFN